jgi:hypothetical protein
MSAIIPERLAAVEEAADIVLDKPTDKQILKYLNSGDRISYVGKDNKYRSGGFVMNIAEDGSSFGLRGGNLRWTLATDKIKQLFIVTKE